MISRLSIDLDKDTLIAFNKDVDLPPELMSFDRVKPKDVVQILVNGKVREASWGFIPSSADNDLQQLNRIGVLTKDLSSSSTYRLIARRNRGLLWAKAFYHNTIKAGIRTRHRFSLQNESQFSIPLIFDHWQEPGTNNRILTFSLLHQLHTTSDERVPSVVPVILKDKSIMKSWLELENKPSFFQWPDFDSNDFTIQSREMDVKMRPSFKAVYPAAELPDFLNNIA